MGEVKKCYRVCDKRIAKNEFGENMCGAIGCCEAGDMLCECEVCDRKCDKSFLLTCFNVHCKAQDGTYINVGVCATDEIAAKNAALKSLWEGRHIAAYAEYAAPTDRI